MGLTDTEIKMIGIKALTAALGEVNAEKFIWRKRKGVAKEV